MRRLAIAAVSSGTPPAHTTNGTFWIASAIRADAGIVKTGFPPAMNTASILPPRIASTAASTSSGVLVSSAGEPSKNITVLPKLPVTALRIIAAR